MTSSCPRILLTGATGYIGGSILSQLLSSPDASKYGPITLLVRGEERKKILLNKFGDKVNLVVFADLDDTEHLIEVASQHDIVINTTLGFHVASPRSLVLGLAKRKLETGKDVWIIHTSGTSNVADKPITKGYIESDPKREFSDLEDIYGYEKSRNAEDPYGQRTTELTLIDTGLETGVKTLVIMSPLIYGVGAGEFNKLSIQVPSLIKATLKYGSGFTIEGGKGEWDHVHISDLATLYQTALDKIISGSDDVPFGKKGIIFSAVARHSWAEVAQGIADAAFKAGQIKINEVKSVGLKDGAHIMTQGNEFWSNNEEIVEYAVTSNSRTKADVAKVLGWKPVKGSKDWQASFGEELKVMIV